MDVDDSVEFEDGEISDAEESYTPLERPANYSTINQLKVVTEYAESEEDEVKSSSDSNSDCGTSDKRPKLKPKIKPLPKSLKRKNNIWCSTIQEDVLLENLTNCDVSHIDRSRNVETYLIGKRRRQFIADTNNHFQCISNDSSNKSEKTKAQTAPDPDDSTCPSKRRKYTNFKREAKQNDTDFVLKDKPNVNPRFILDVNCTVEDSEETIAKDIANKLCEEKEELVLSVVNIAGRSKALSLFKETQLIEEEGGLMIFNHKRRRTPGGIFFYLVKNDSELTDEQQNLIFREEKLKFKKEIRIKQKMKLQEFKKRQCIKVSKSLPKLESCNEVKSDLKEDVSEPDVKNPPPSPSTDGPENSTDGLENVNHSGATRNVVNYDDDCLDIGIDIDLM